MSVMQIFLMPIGSRGSFQRAEEKSESCLVSRMKRIGEFRFGSRA